MWVLIIFLHAGWMSKGDSMTSQAVTGFTTEQACQHAGAKASNLVNGTKKEAAFACVQVK